jgi:threonine/homoserine/homoserine lactone efflux protein
MLTSAIGDLLPLAVGVALSPVPIIAVILMLATPKARPNGVAFAAGWIAGLVVVSVITLAVTGGADTSDTVTTGIEWGRLLIGLLFLAMAARQWSQRPRKGEPATMPKWMSTIDTFKPGKSLVLGAALSGVNPKNLALTAAAAVSIAEAGLSTGQSAVAVAVFVVLGSLTVVGPVLFYLIAADKAAGPLASIKDLMSDHNAVIMMVVLLVLGAKLIGQGLAGVTN